MNTAQLAVDIPGLFVSRTDAVTAFALETAIVCVPLRRSRYGHWSPDLVIAGHQTGVVRRLSLSGWP